MSAFPWGALGSLVDTGVSLWSSNKDRAFQKKQAMNQISWRVADAKRAGIHPLAALGVNPAGSIVNPVQPSLGEAGRSLEDYLAKPSADQVARSLKENQKLDAEIELLKAQSRSITADALSKARGGAGRTAGRILEAPGGPKLDPRGSSPAQRWQDEYGDIVENAYGLGKLVYDLLDNYVPKSFVRGQREMWRRSRGSVKGKWPSVSNSR